MDKTKTNLVIIIALIVLCIVIAIYAADLNSQLGAEKIRIMQLNDQIAGLNAKAGGLEAQLTGLKAQSNDQTNLVSGLQKSLSAASLELESLKAAYAELESKLKAQEPANQ
jgi:predicted  nucleic acid-binding Zn-ribbon protein